MTLWVCSLFFPGGVAGCAVAGLMKQDSVLYGRTDTCAGAANFAQLLCRREQKEMAQADGRISNVWTPLEAAAKNIQPGCRMGDYPEHPGCFSDRRDQMSWYGVARFVQQLSG